MEKMSTSSPISAMLSTVAGKQFPPGWSRARTTFEHSFPAARRVIMSIRVIAARANLNRRQFLVTAAIGITAAGTATVLPTRPAPAAGTDAIRPFRINIPGSALADLRKRIKATRWPDKETVTDDSQGVPLVTMQELSRYWATGYDWRKVEARLNALPQFITEIDGLDIHFIHVRSKHENALPLI